MEDRKQKKFHLGVRFNEPVQVQRDRYYIG